MGSGKSTLGRRVADTVLVPFFDTDQIIESQTGMNIMDIFSTHGEDYFRHLESDILRQTSFYPKSINATGGGLPCFEENMSWMNQHGITVYLEWSDDGIKTHLMQIRNSRPLLFSYSDIDAEHKIKDLLKLRKPVYEQSAITLEMSGKEDDDCRLLEKACRYIW